MSEPQRLREAGPDDVRALLRATPPSRAMTGDEKALSRARLAGHLTAAAVAGGLSWVPGAAIGAGLGLIVGLATLLVPGWSSSDPSLSTPAVVPPTAAAAPSPVDTPMLPVSASPVVESPSSPSRSMPVQAAATGTGTLESPEDMLAEEVALLDRARAALGGNPSEALRLTADHAARFPRGKMGIERELVAIDALRRLGRGAEARSRAESLLVRARGSLYEDRIRKMLDAAP